MKQSTRYPGVKRLSDGKFEIRVKSINSKNGKERDIKRVVAASSPSEAVAIREELRRETEAATAAAPLRVRLVDVATSWLRTKVPSLKRSTRDTYALVLDAYVLPTLGDYYLDAIQPDDLVKWRDLQATTPIGDEDDDEEIRRFPSPVTVNSRLRVLKQLLAEVTYERGLPNPAARISALRVPRRREPKGLNASELQEMLTKMRELRPRSYPITLTLALTGARWGEVAALKWEHVDESRKVIVFAQAHVRGHLDTTKTDSIREVPLAPELAEALAGHRRYMVEKQVPGLADGWVFPSRTDGLMQPSTLRKPLRSACKAAGIRIISPHGLRYTFNHLARQVAAREVVRSMTGHVTEEMTTH